MILCRVVYNTTREFNLLCTCLTSIHAGPLGDDSLSEHIPSICPSSAKGVREPPTTAIAPIVWTYGDALPSFA
jgi:hypothetical protein